MPTNEPDTDYDEQDAAEVFDEDNTTGADEDLSDAMDIRRNVLDVTSALGDEDLEEDELAVDASEADEELLSGLELDADEDDLDDDNADSDPLAVDDIPDFTSDRDFADEDDVDGVSAHPGDEPEVISMGDVDALGGERGERVADLESDNLSDSDLVELDYKEA